MRAMNFVLQNRIRQPFTEATHTDVHVHHPVGCTPACAPIMHMNAYPKQKGKHRIGGTSQHNGKNFGVPLLWALCRTEQQSWDGRTRCAQWIILDCIAPNKRQWDLAVAAANHFCASVEILPHLMNSLGRCRGLFTGAGIPNQQSEGDPPTPPAAMGLDGRHNHPTLCFYQQ